MSGPSDPCRLVVCDDSSALVRLLELVFDVEDGIEVVGTAGDGVEVVDVCRQLQPDVLLLDIAMPRRDGIGALPHVCAASPRTRVLMYTGFASDAVRREALDAGADDLVLKGGSPVDLADRIRRLHCDDD
jgi:two-component system, chemotaxis family, chemotaxis protein CheY